MYSNDDKKMERQLRLSINKAFKQTMQNLNQEPSVILENEDTADIPDSLIEEIETWLFRRRTENGDTYS